LFISAGWIRPEDTARYEALGYSTFKLLERNIPSEVLVERARAYHDRRWEGNLADLLLSWGFKKRPPQWSPVHMLKAFRAWKMPLGLAKDALAFMKGQGMLLYTQPKNPIFIDSAAIPANFLDRFQKGRCNQRNCSDCGYCEGIANRAVSIDPQFLEEILPIYENLETKLVAGQF